MRIIPRKFSLDFEENKNKFSQKLREDLKGSEGYEAKVYSDTIGIPTIGYGYALIRPYFFPVDEKVTKNLF